MRLLMLPTRTYRVIGFATRAKSRAITMIAESVRLSELSEIGTTLKHERAVFA